MVKLDGPQPVAGILKDMGDGTYNASFSVSKKGEYTVFVGLSYNLYYETAIYGSPFKIKVPRVRLFVTQVLRPHLLCSS